MRADRISLSLLGTLAAAATAAAQPAAPRPSESLFAQALAAPEQVAASPATDFGSASAACAAALQPAGLDVTRLNSEWAPISLSGEPDGKNFAFGHSSSAIRFFLSTTFAPGGHCVVDGYGTSKSQFGAIAGEVKKQVGAALGVKLKETGSSSTPYSRGQGFRSDDFMVIISSENHPAGINIRVTLTRIDPAKSAFEFANAAGMAAQYLPSMLAPRPAPNK